ncbi:MAG: DUF2589 domain-containing protein [Gemmatimonadaceae bacterium]
MPVVLSNSEALSLGTTIGTILTAIVDAQAQSARATVEFVNEVGFTTPVPNEPDRLRSVTFRYRKRDADNKLAEFSVDIPLLGMVDIPVISIKKATITFNYEITQSQTAPQPTGPPLKASPLAGRIPAAALMKGRVLQAGKTTDDRERATLAVTIEIEKSPLPIGLERVLDILEAAAAEAQVPPPAPPV